VPIGPGEPVGKSRGSRTGVDVARRRVGYGDGREVRGAGVGGLMVGALTILPTDAMSPCLV
jgi:hypothetical protein